MKQKLPKQLNNGIFQWYLKIFAVTTLIFILTLIPFIIYLQRTFVNLQLKETQNRLDTCASMLDSTVTGVLNIPQSLSSNADFLPFCIPRAYTTIYSSTRTSLQKVFAGLLAPLDLVEDAAIYAGNNTVITPHYIFWEDRNPTYYPKFFHIKDMSREEWVSLLNDIGTGFLPVSHMTTYTKEYDALIYVAKWRESSYVYACINIEDIADILFSESEQAYCHFTITNSKGDPLYVNFPEDQTDVHTLSKQTVYGGLQINIHISNDLFYQKMQPLYVFLVAYFAICLILLTFTVFTGSRISSRPFQQIISTLDDTINKESIAEQTAVSNLDTPNPNSFDYIADSIRNAGTALNLYQNILFHQETILQTRFLEKALNGQLNSAEDTELFHTYFPQFPESFCLILLRLNTTQQISETPYSDPLLLLQTYLQSELPTACQLQLNQNDLLLIFSEEALDHQMKTLEYLIDNVNREEPGYEIVCVTSKCYDHLESLPAAYRQVQQMIDLPFTEEHQLIHTVNEYPEISQSPLLMTDLMTLYTAITHGNREIALNTLRTFVDNAQLAQLSDLHIYEMIRAILNCILFEHPLQLIDQHIPPYRADVNTETGLDTKLYDQLEELITTFCELIIVNPENETISFSKQLVKYVDEHYTDYDLCIATLETVFDRSSTYIRQTFKAATQVTVTKYIEQKRLQHASMLLARNEKNIEKIALECGYANANSFYKAYKRVYGHSPVNPGG